MKTLLILLAVACASLVTDGIAAGSRVGIEEVRIDAPPRAVTAPALDLESLVAAHGSAMDLDRDALPNRNESDQTSFRLSELRDRSPMSVGIRRADIGDGPRFRPKLE
jgi:hypothetical protein